MNATTGDHTDYIVLVTGAPSLATCIESQWTLWQTGYPDVLDTATVIVSMRWPLLIGILGIFLLTALMLRRRRQLRL